MMLFRTLFILPFLVVGCSSSEPESEQAQYPNLITVNTPENQSMEASNAYIDSVKIIDYKKEKALLITGNLANGCTYLKEVSHTANGNALAIILKTWKPADKICSQALVPFSFIYNEMTSTELKRKDSVSVNQQSFIINRP